MGFSFAGLGQFAGGLAQGGIRGYHLGKDMEEMRIQKGAGEAYTKGAQGLGQLDTEGSLANKEAAAIAADPVQARNGAMYTPESSAKIREEYTSTAQGLMRDPTDGERRRAGLEAQGDYWAGLGKADKASGLFDQAERIREKEDLGKIRSGASAGLTKDMNEDEKMFATSKGLYEAALGVGRHDLAAGYYNQMTQARETLLSRSNDRADRVYRATGNVSGFIDSYNKFVADGQTIDDFKKNDDGSHVFTVNNGKGSTRSVTVSKEQLGDYLLGLRDAKRIGELEQQRASILAKAQADAQEALNKPVAVGKDQTLVVPSTGQTFAPRAGQFDVKEANPVLDDARKMILERSTNFDQGTGKWNWTPEAAAKAGIAERLYMKNPSLTPAMMAEIADKGTVGTAIVEIDGKQQRVPAVTHGGRTFILGGSDAGQAAPQPAASGTGTRSVTGKIGAPQGLERAPSRATATPADFPRVSPQVQAERDGERRAILARELETTPKDGSPARKALEAEARRAGVPVNA